MLFKKIFCGKLASELPRLQGDEEALRIGSNLFDAARGVWLTNAPFPYSAMKTFLCSHLVTLRWDGRRIGANLEKISATGASVSAEESLHSGERVAIDAGTLTLHGVVAGCKPDATGYEIDFTLDTEWSPEIFIPDHLFDPDVLLAPPWL